MTFALMPLPYGGGELDDDERAELNELAKVWSGKLGRNLLRREYYDSHNVLKDLGISIPPHMREIEVALNWPKKSVDVLARRCKVDSFVAPNVSGDDPFGVLELWRRNDMDIEAPQMIRSVLKYSCAFFTASRGEVADGEPEILLSSQSALFGSGVWDFRRRRLRSALSITDIDGGKVAGWVMFMRGKTIRAQRSGSTWSVEKYEHDLDRLPVEVLPYDPDLDRPFGCSRISRTVMGLTDSALRTLARMETHAEFFSAPQRWAMGADESHFVDQDGKPVGQWQSITGRIWALPRDPDTGDIPTVGQFSAASPQPHTDQLRTLASAFSAATSIPLSECGVVSDANPIGGAAIEASERPLVQIARDAHDNLGPRIARLMASAVQIRDGLRTVPADMLRLSTQWRDPEEIPQSAAGDFLVKVIQAMPKLAESRVPLEQLGWDTTTVDRAMSDMRRASGSRTLLNALQQQASGSTQDVPAAPVP